MVTWSMVKEERLLIETLQNGIADFKDLTEDLKPYQRYANSLHTVFGVVMMGEKIIILFSLRKHILAALHAAHQGCWCHEPTYNRLCVLVSYHSQHH